MHVLLVSYLVNRYTYVTSFFLFLCPFDHPNMVKKKCSIKPATPSELHQLAERRLQHSNFSTPSSPDEMIKVIHELSVHQIELEMQQETLMQTEEKLNETLDRYTDLYDFAPLGYLTLGRDSTILEANLTATKMLGVELARLQGKHLKQFVIPEHYRVIDILLDKIFKERVAGYDEVILVTDIARQASVPHLLSGRTVRLDAAISETSYACRIILSDITEQKRTERELHRLNRALQATNLCNQALIHCTDEKELLQKICSIMVEIGGYRMAWVGYTENNEAKSINAVAQAGFEQGFLESTTFTWADVPLGQGPTGMAIRIGQPYIMRDMQKDPNFEPRRRQALKRGYASSLSLPLKTVIKVFGAITIYSAIPNAFDTEETQLLTALADNLAYGITMLRNSEKRQQAENALRESERTFRSITEQMAEEVFVINSIGTLTYVSPVVEQLFGYLPHEIIGHPFTDYMLEKDIPEALQVFNNTLQHKTANQIFEVKLKRKDSSFFDGEIHLQYYQDQEISGGIGLILDITQRKHQEILQKQYELELKENQHFLACIYEEVNLSIFVVDVRPDGGFRFKGINPIHEKLTGINNKEIAEKTPEEFLEPEVAVAVIHNYERCIQKGKAVQYEESIPFMGRHTWWRTTLNPVRNEAGHIYRIIGTSENITERKLANDQLKKMSAAVEQSPAVIVITDAQGTIEYVNPMFTDLTGYGAEEAKGINPRILQSGLTAKSVYDELWKTIVSGNIWHGEWQNKKKNGELFWESVVISAIQNQEGVITNFVAVKEDITRQKKMVSELITAKEHAEESDRLKSAFLANISHEIRTPMNGILGFSELLKEPHLTGEEQAEYIDLIQQSGQRMLNLINDLIDISRLEAGETKLQITPTPVNKVLRDLHAFFMPAISKKKLRLHCTPELSDTESIIETDNVKLTQILTNLLQNALKFTRTGTIDFGYTREGTTLEFHVTDTGIGIPFEMQEKIFDRFRQVDNTLTRNHEGSGLGLSITKAYVAMLGGKLSVQSVEGAGSTFTFTLPYNPVNTPIPSTQPNSSI